MMSSIKVEIGSPNATMTHSFNPDSVPRDHHTPSMISAFGISSMENWGGYPHPPQTPHPTKPKEKNGCCWNFLRCLFPCCFSQHKVQPAILVRMQTLLKEGKFAQILQSLSSKRIHHGQLNDINIKNEDGETILFLLCWHEKDTAPLHLDGIEFLPSTALIQLIIDYGAYLEVRNRHERGFIPRLTSDTRFLIVNSATENSIESNPNLTLVDAIERAILCSQGSWIGVGHSAIDTWVNDKAAVRKKYLQKAIAKIPNWDTDTVVDFPTPKRIFKVAVEYSHYEEWRKLLRAMVSQKNSTPRSFQNNLNEEFEFLLNKIYDLSQPNNLHLAEQLEGYKQAAEMLAQGRVSPVYPEKLAVGASYYEKSTQDFFAESGWDPKGPQKGSIIRLHNYT